MLYNDTHSLPIPGFALRREKLKWPLALLLSAAAGGALAQQGGDGTKSLRLSTVIVTSQKREEAVQEIPVTLNVLGGDKFQKEEIGTSAQEVVNYIPNASAFGSNHGKPRWWIRGIGTGNPQPDATSPIGVYHDDVYIANSEYTGLPVFDLERVEILSGPQGTLWGKNTTGGAINIISKQPRFRQDGYLKFTYGSDEFKVAEGAVGGGLIDEKLAGRLSFHQDKIGPQYRNITTGGREGTVQDRVVRGQLLAVFTPDLTATLNLHNRVYETAGRSPSGSVRNPGTDYYWPLIERNPRNDVIEGPDGTHTNQGQLEQNGANLRLRWNLDSGHELTSITAYDTFRNWSIAAPGELSANATDNQNEEYQFSQEVRLTSPRADRFNWIAGFHYFTNEYERQLYTATFAGLPQPTGRNSAANRLVDASYTFDSESYALFLSTTYNFTDSVYLTTGLRFTNENKTVKAYRTTWGADTTFGDQIDWLRTVNLGSVLSGASNTFTYADANHDETWDAVTWDITPTWRIDPNKRVYLRYARGIKAGGFNTNITRADQLRVLDPETLDSLETGFKSELFDNRLFLNASLFGYIFKDAQVNISGPYGAPNIDTGVQDNLSVLQNIPKGKGYGAEVTVQALVTENLSVNANLGLLRTEFDRFNVEDTSTWLSGSEFVRSPHATALLQADYRIPFNNGNTVILSGDWRFQDRQFFYVNNQDNPLLQQKAYALVNFRVAFETEGAKDLVTLSLNNAFDKEHYVHGSVVSQSASVNGWGRTEGPERNWLVSYIRRW